MVKEGIQFVVFALMTVQLLKAQTLPAPPSGFKLKPDPLAGNPALAKVMGLVSAEGPNAGWPKECMIDPRIELSYGWRTWPQAARTVEYSLKAPEEKGHSDSHSSTEPAGKTAYKGGVLAWQKRTEAVIGTIGNRCKLKEVVFWNANFTFPAGDKLCTVNVSRFFANRSSAQALLDEYIDKMKHAMGVQ